MAPWYVVPSDRKWYRNLAIGNLLHETLTNMNPQWPAADFDVDEQKRRLADEVPVDVIPTVAVTRYVTPLREGGSLPGIVEADDLGTYVCKFRGAGQGVRVLVAEVIVAGLAERIGLRTPRLVALDLDPAIARYEADEEVQDLLNASPGLNLGVDFLPGSFGFDGHVPAGSTDPVRVLWLDAFVANVDRSWRNPNLLLWHGNLWVIDHGAAPLLPPRLVRRSRATPIASPHQPWSADDHVFREHAAELPRRRRRAPRLPRRESVFTEVLAKVPDEWLEPVPGAEDPEARARGVRRLPHRPPRHHASGFPGQRHDGAAASWPTSTSCSAASRAWTARSSSTSAWCCTARRPTSSTSPGTSTATGCSPSTRASTSTRSARPWPSSTRVCAGHPTGGAAAAAAADPAVRLPQGPALAPSSRPAPSTAASPPTPAASSNASSNSSWADASRFLVE